MSCITQQQLEANFTGRALLSGGEQYFDIPTSFDFIESCGKNGFAVIGVEGFEIIEGKLAPRMDLIADFSELNAPIWSEFMDCANHSAISFAKEIENRSVLLGFTILSRSEWETERQSS
jgi:hypothetical protein